MPVKPKLFDLVGHYLPKIPGRLRTKLLYECTAHPCGDREYVRQQVIRLSKETDGTLEGCMAFAQRQFDLDVAEAEDLDPDSEVGDIEKESDGGAV